ncbi:MAG: twin-arginine translocase TatA/TatE family subunit [Bifidobacteriaceae bacterium]|nr:twin-arginine translocase TatA/TatE family subunit [Bifidobacteriaceae bacterium]MCI1979483.1 twin-arginine translocase TatA/TatE family subunit [Bifidobacteriaceae bacterium]
MFFGISGTEVIVILLVGLFVTNPVKLPDYARRFGKFVSEMRRRWQAVKSSVDQETRGVTDALNLTEEDKNR